jgi:hypothetical protein
MSKEKRGPGRPPREGPKPGRIEISLEAADMARLDEARRKRGLSRSSAARQALLIWIEGILNGGAE